MGYREAIDIRRQAAQGYALYVMDAPADCAQTLSDLGFGRMVSCTPWHREHPHSAYLFDTKAASPGARRTDTLILPSGSLKRVREYDGNAWQTVTDYCFRPHHWAKLGLHLTDLEAVPDRYAAEAARQNLNAGDLLASVLPASPIAMLCREFCPAEFAAQQTAVNAAAVKKARRQLMDFAVHAASAALAVQADLYWQEERLPSPYPELLSDALREDHKKTDPETDDAPLARPVSTGDTVLSSATRSPILPACALPGEVPEGASWVLLEENWTEAAQDWVQYIRANPEPVYFFPNLSENPRILSGILRQKEEESGQIL